MVPNRYKCSVLVVDDEPTVLTMLKAVLANDFEVETAPDAEEGRRAFERRGFDIVLADQQLPGQSGVQFLQWVRLHSPSTVRMLMTGTARLEDAVDAINCGQVRRFLFKPWRAEQLLQVMREEARQFLLERSHDQLLEELRRLNLELEQRVQDRTRELELANRQLQQRNLMLQRMALTDALTGLPNRRGMDRLADNELKRRLRNPSPLALALIDADHFKNINSRYLLSGGDHVLTWLAHTLSNSVRTVDYVGRVGGEEFMLLAPETNYDGAAILSERIRQTVEKSHTTFHGENIRITVSVGMVVVEADAVFPYEHIRHTAAEALSEAKGRGRNRCVLRTLTANSTPAPPPAFDGRDVEEPEETESPSCPRHPRPGRSGRGAYRADGVRGRSEAREGPGVRAGAWLGGR